MADIDTGGGKVSTKVDMTPMVDLGFLLITFFMLTTTFSTPQVMEIVMPEKTPDNETMKVSETRSTVFILGPDDKLVYYTGFTDPEPKQLGWGPDGLRQYMRNKNRTVQAQEGKDAIYLIKSMKNAKYKNLVDIIDEMAIAESKVYAIVDITDADEDLFNKAVNGETAAAATN